MNHILLDGHESLMQGMLVNVCIAIAASIVRVALWGWQGIRAFVAGLCVGCFAAICASWILSLYELPQPVEAVIIGFAAILGKDALTVILAPGNLRQLLSAIQTRILHEIVSRGAHAAPGGASQEYARKPGGPGPYGPGPECSARDYDAAECSARNITPAPDIARR